MKKLPGLFLLPLAMLVSAAHGEGWPERSVTLVVPFPPGGSSDAIARTLSTGLTDRLGKPFVVENRPGATGTIGAAQVKRAPADGYTLLVTSLGPLVITPHLMKGLPYDPLTDFDAITNAVQAPNVLVVPASSPHKSVADVIEFQRRNPGKMTFASSGAGSSDHLTAELFWQQTKTSGLHVPYKGGGPAMTDLLGGQVDASFQNINAVVQHVKSGKLRALAITSRTRSPVLPDVPTLDESGVPNTNVYSWQGVVGPKGLPPDVRAKLYAAIVATLSDPQVKANLVALGFEVVASSPTEFAAFQAAEYARWKSVIQAGKITIE